MAIAGSLGIIEKSVCVFAQAGLPNKGSYAQEKISHCTFFCLVDGSFDCSKPFLPYHRIISRAVVRMTRSELTSNGMVLRRMYLFITGIILRCLLLKAERVVVTDAPKPSPVFRMAAPSPEISPS
jgi:hypothetical protein